jgi:cellulose synthase/poly-beta-1,6-N-acetylglucosamine synthase-like glycosyltransferase
LSNWLIALIFYNIFVILYFITINGFYLMLMFVSAFGLQRSRLSQKISQQDKPFLSEFYKPLSIIIPAYNEEATIAATVMSALSLRYPEFEVVVVNDGSADATMISLDTAFNLQVSARDYTLEIPCSAIKGVYSSTTYPNLVVVDKANGGKSDALNAGINISLYPLFCNIDSDSLIDTEALLKVVELFARDWRVVAAGGTIRAANHCRIEDGRVVEINLSPKFWVRFQIVEYLRAFLFGRAGWSALGGLLILSGAFSIFRRKTVVAAGGYRVDTVGEDMELILRLQRFLRENNREYRVVFLPDPVCWTQVPEDYRSLQNQRRRWQRGLSESLIHNFSMFMNPRYGSVGMISFPFFIFFEFLGPLIELTGYLMLIIALFLGIINPPFALLFFAAAVLLGIVLSTAALLMEENYYRSYPNLRDIITLFAYAVMENFFYRQLHTWWRIKGLFDFLLKRGGWGTLTRHRFEADNYIKNGS